MQDLVVSFAGTGQEPDRSDGRGRTLAWRLPGLLDAAILYEPGIGTLGIPFISPLVQALGHGLAGRVDDQLDRILHYPDHRVSVVGESRGGQQAHAFAVGYQDRFGKPVHLFLAVDSVSSIGFGAAKRLFPRSWWRRAQVARPPCIHGYHLCAGEEPQRFFVHDEILAVETFTFPVLAHGEVLRSPKVLDFAFCLCVGVGIRGKS